MPVDCPRCRQVVEFVGQPPARCPHCGYDLVATTPPTPGPQEAATLPPAPHEAATLAPTPAPGLAAEAATLVPASSVAGEGPRSLGQVGGYRLLRPLGAGGMGAVYEAEDVASGQHVALKLISSDFSLAGDAVERFRREGQLASRITHPRCVFVLAADQEGDQPYIAMELMPGQTLQDVVRERGPLPVEEAVARILDVIDGLEAAHRLGILHRDVKPSNCFLEPDGRAKIGDFGLAKPAVQPADDGTTSRVGIRVDGATPPVVQAEQLTARGAFVGTPLYASPEQVLHQPLDERSDLYAAASTLYFLLTGQAPFETGDSTLTLVRIATEDPPPPRSLRPDLPGRLERVLLRGLERDPARRWRDLATFRAALRPFAPGELTIGGIGLRFLAWQIDGLLLFAPNLLLGLWSGLFAALVFRGWLSGQVLYLLQRAIFALPLLAYFTLLEGLLGWSVGKWLFRLRVYPSHSSGPPGIWRAFLRALVLCALLHFLVLIVILARLVGDWWPMDPQTVGTELEGLHYLLLVIGLVVAISPMRRRNGYRGVHDLLSGTRVVRLRPAPKRREPTQRRGDAGRTRSGEQRAVSVASLEQRLGKPADLPERVGAFAIQGEVGCAAAGRVLLGRDALGRDVLVWLRPTGAMPFDSARRQLSRAGRLRWLAGGQEDAWQWDALLPPAGRPLAEIVPPNDRLFWPQARPFLEQLADELVLACREGTLPPCVTPNHVWVDDEGQLQLADLPLRAPPASDVGPAREHTADGPAMGEDRPARDARRAVVLLGQVATLLLEGTARPADAPPAPVRAPVPLHAARMLKRLLRVPQRPIKRSLLFRPIFDDRPVLGHEPYGGPAELQQDLAATRDEPVEVSRGRRALQLVPQAWFVLWFFLCMGGPMVLISRDSLVGALVLANLLLVVSVGTAFITRGGYLRLWFMRGIVVRRLNGEKPGRLRCAGRALLVWAAPTALLLLAILGRGTGSEIVSLIPLLLLIPLFLGYAVHIVLTPSRGLHDRIMGTYVVPE